MSENGTPYASTQPGPARSATVHVVVGTAICLATVLLFAAFWTQLPPEVPIQLTIDGSPGNTLPRAVAAFGLPLATATVNLLAVARHPAKAGDRVYRYYVTPAVSIVLSVATIVMALMS
ncbi:DUF1648 domain-containing protein [Xylanimonas ulmi]